MRPLEFRIKVGLRSFSRNYNNRYRDGIPLIKIKFSPNENCVQWTQVRPQWK